MKAVRQLQRKWKQLHSPPAEEVEAEEEEVVKCQLKVYTHRLSKTDKHRLVNYVGYIEIVNENSKWKMLKFFNSNSNNNKRNRIKHKNC